jgi:hypothetical protein
MFTNDMGFKLTTLKTIAVLGAVSLMIGMGWLMLWMRSVRGGQPQGSLAYEVRPPVIPRLMIAAGVVTLVAALIKNLTGKLARKKMTS